MRFEAPSKLIKNISCENYFNWCRLEWNVQWLELRIFNIISLAYVRCEFAGHKLLVSPTHTNQWFHVVLEYALVISEMRYQMWQKGSVVNFWRSLSNHNQVTHEVCASENRTGRKTLRSRNMRDLKMSYPNDRTSFLSNYTTATNCNHVASVFWWHHKKLSRSHSVFFSMYLSPKCVQFAFNVLSWMDMTRVIAQHSDACIQRDRRKRKILRKRKRISSCDRTSRNKKFSLCWPWPALTCDTYHFSVGYHRYTIKCKCASTLYRPASCSKPNRMQWMASRYAVIKVNCDLSS